MIGTNAQLNVHKLYSGVKREIQQTWKRHSQRKKRININRNSSLLWNVLSLSPKQLLLSSEHPSYVIVHFLLHGSSWTHFFVQFPQPLLLTFLLTRPMPSGSAGDRTGSKCSWVRKFWSELFASFFLASSTQRAVSNLLFFQLRTLTRLVIFKWKGGKSNKEGYEGMLLLSS